MDASTEYDKELRHQSAKPLSLRCGIPGGDDPACRPGDIIQSQPA
jgi:hypothetical protein